MDTKQEKEREAVLRNFFTPEGILKQIPVQRKKKRFVLEKMLEGFVVGRKYSEKEINEHIKTFHPDSPPFGASSLSTTICIGTMGSMK